MTDLQSISVQPMVKVKFGKSQVFHNGSGGLFVQFECGKIIRLDCSPDGTTSIRNAGKTLLLFDGEGLTVK